MDKKVAHCLICGYETDASDDKEFFCSHCGAPVLNKCSNYECEQILNSDAKYCKFCGSTSTFLNYGMFTLNSPVDDEVLPF